MVTGTSLQVTAGTLEAGKKYRWNMRAFGYGLDSGYTERKYFTAPGTYTEPTPTPNATESWTGSKSQSWDDPLNWSANRLPTSTDTVAVNGGVLDMPYGTVAANVLLNSGVVNWTGGTISSGLFQVASGAVLNVSGSNTKALAVDATLVNSGTITQSGAGSLYFGGSVDHPATLSNLAGGVYDLQTDGTAMYTTGGYYASYGTFTNAGTLGKSAGIGETYLGQSNTFTFNNTGTVRATSGTLRFNADTGSSTGGTFSFANGGKVLLTDTFTFQGVNTGTGDGTLVLSGTSFVIPSDFGPATGNGTMGLTVDPGTSVTFATSQHLGKLTVNGTATFAAGGGRVLRVTGLAIGAGGRFDLNDNDLIYDYTGSTSQAAVIRALIAAGRAGGAWTGFGLTSTAAKNRVDGATTLGYMEATDYQAIYGANATFDGEALDATAVLVKYTVYGDANFDGKTDFNDFLRLQTGFGNTASSSAFGDFNTDGVTDFNDFLVLQTNFGQSL